MSLMFLAVFWGNAFAENVDSPLNLQADLGYAPTTMVRAPLTQDLAVKSELSGTALSASVSGRAYMPFAPYVGLDLKAVQFAGLGNENLTMELSYLQSGLILRYPFRTGGISYSFGLSYNIQNASIVLTNAPSFSGNMYLLGMEAAMQLDEVSLWVDLMTMGDSGLLGRFEYRQVFKETGKTLEYFTLSVSGRRHNAQYVEFDFVQLTAGIGIRFGQFE